MNFYGLLDRKEQKKGADSDELGEIGKGFLMNFAGR